MKLRLFLSLLIGALCLWLALKDVSWAGVLSSLGNLKLLPLFLMSLTFFVTHAFRARRWMVLIKPIKVLSWKELFAINSVGFLAIHVFPFRLGEVTRPLLLKRRHQIPLTTGIGVVAVERVFDGLSTMLVLMVGLMFLPEHHIQVSHWSLDVSHLMLLSFLVFVPIFLFFLLAAFAKDRALAWLDILFRIFPTTFREHLMRLAGNFVLGLKSLPNAYSLMRIVFESVGVWGVVVLGYWLCIQSFGLDLHWGAAFSVLGISAIGLTVPGPPGFVGTYQLFVQAALVLYGVSKSTGLAYSLVFYTFNLVYVSAAGIAFLSAMATPVGKLYSDLSDSTASQE